MKDITYDVRIYKTEVYKGARVTTHTVRWKTAGKSWKRPFRNAAQADTFRGELQAAARKGEAFSLITGEPVSWNRAEKTETSWYDFTVAYVDMKWKRASAGYRRDIARALTAATPAMLESNRGKPSDREIRKALTRWVFNTKDRGSHPSEYGPVIEWLKRNALPVSTLGEAAIVRSVLDTATSKLTGKPAAASTARRNRAILFNALEYAVELKLLNANPIRGLKWQAPKNSHEVNRDCAVNPDQARKLLAAVKAQKRSGPRLVAFFAILYFAGLRPEEAMGLRKANVILPALEWNKETDEWEEPSDAWGELRFRKASPDVGKEWTDEGTQREERQLKHRAEGDSRTVPCPPELVKILRAHMDAFPPTKDGLLFAGVNGGDLPTITYRRAWDRARAAVLTKTEYSSPLGKRIYDLRHACLSTWSPFQPGGAGQRRYGRPGLR
ncbi:tyrosine-type recombinase/integrase [Planobispora longispora]|uniref:Integrase n=1 Tax=Planobispora longispora TaxID=28887 RepID=A0A8J3W8Z8_9ACTN|nr:integrase [Planobispora longispora]GIH81199.1 integrase [Planobispora longispora]